MPIITPMPAPQAAAPSTSAQDARSRVIAMLTQAPAQSNPVPNPSQVSPEEMGALGKTKEQKDNEVEAQAAASAPTEVTPAPKVEDPLSTQYANLARKEKAIRAKALEMRAREDAFKVQEAAYKAKDAEYQDKFIPKDRIAQDTLSVLAEAGITGEALTNLVLNMARPDEVTNSPAMKQLKAEIQALKDAQEEAKKSYNASQEASYKQAVNQIRTDTKQLVFTDPEFETIKETNSVDDVVELIERTFKEEGLLLSIDEAARAVEDHLVEEAMKVARIKKIQQRLQPPAAAPVQNPGQTPKQPQTVQMRTLTNAISTTGKVSSRDRAILAFKGEKKA